MNDTEARSIEDINRRLARIEELLKPVLALISRYEPMLAEAARRMEGPLRWRRDRG